MPDLLDLDKAKKELEAKDLLAIERETALTWGGRAAASYAFVLDEADHAERMRCFWEAETYRAEAIEHAAMTEDARFLERLTVEVEGHRAKARNVLLAAGHGFVAGSRTPKSLRGERPPAASAAAPKPMTWETVDEPPSKPARPPQAPGATRPSPATPGLGRRPENENRLA